MFKLRYLIIILLVSIFNSDPKKAAAAELSLGLYPPLISIKAYSENSIKTPLTIQNNSNSPVSLSIVFKAITASKKENGEIAFASQKEQNRLQNLLEARKIYLIDQNTPSQVSISELELGPKETKNLTLVISLAQDEKESDYYFTILFISKNASSNVFDTRDKTEKSASIRINGGIGINVLLSINPKEQPKEAIEEFSTQPFRQAGSVAFVVRLKNLSTHVMQPHGTIYIKNLFNQTIGAVELPPVNILAGTIRKVPNTIWKETFLLGPYSATLNKKTVYFFAFPLKGLIYIFIGLCIVSIVYSKLKKRT